MNVLREYFVNYDRILEDFLPSGNVGVWEFEQEEFLLYSVVRSDSLVGNGLRIRNLFPPQTEDT